jgi:hypothetical protein
MRRLTNLVLDYLRQAVMFLAASTGVAALTTIVLPFIGYATFGDRPGPGWYGPPSHLTWGALRELAEYALALPVFGAIAVLIYFIVPFAVVRALQHFGLPVGVVRIAGALLCAVVAAVVITGAGWYISLGAVAGGAGVFGGLIYGAVVLPRNRQAQSVVSVSAPVT